VKGTKEGRTERRKGRPDVVTEGRKEGQGREGREGRGGKEGKEGGGMKGCTMGGEESMGAACHQGA
jgi:hypothetical protein